MRSRATKNVGFDVTRCELLFPRVELPPCAVRRSSMAELQSTDQITEAVNPSDENLPLLSENLLDNVLFISPLTSPLPSLEDQIWIDSDSAMSGDTEKPLASSLKAYDCPVLSEPESLLGLIPPEVVRRTKATEYECLQCGKVFRTTNALNRHLLIHQSDRPHVCDICQRGFKRPDHLMSHLLTHQKRKTLCCQKVAVKHHCASQPSSTPWETPAETEGHSVFLSPPIPASVSQLSQYACCRASYSSYTGFASVVGNLGLNHYPEQVSLSDIKLPLISETWGLPAMDFPASHDALPSNQWAPTVHPWSVGVDPMAPESPETKNSKLQGWEDDLDFPVTKGVLSVQPCQEAASAGEEQALKASLACPKKNQPILRKHSLQQLKPQSKQQASFISGIQPCSHSEFGLVASTSCQRAPPGLPGPPPSKGRKRRVRKKTPDTPALPLPAPRASTQRRARLSSAYLFSPSQVAMASFSTESAPSHTIKKREKRGEAVGHNKGSQGFQVSPLVIPVSVPVLGKEAPSNDVLTQSVSMQTEKHQKVKDLSKKSRRADLLSTLIIPRPFESGGQGCRPAAVYPSQLRSPTYFADLKSDFQPPPYTPPPMLSPLRPGTGLYFCTMAQYQPCPPLPSSCSTSLDEQDMMSLMIDNTVVSVEPRINIGSCFQAEIPPLRNRLLMLYDEHPAQLVWAPWGDISNNPETQQRVTVFLNMCCSSVLPGGGTNTELALHCLHEVQGDILAALDLLLVREDYRTSSHPLSDYHYTGSDQWNTQERKLFRKALLKHNKDFQLIHNMLQTKSVSQCVEYYYAMKKLKKLKQRKRVEKADRTAQNSVEFHSVAEDKSETRSGIRRSLNRPKGTHEWRFRDFLNAKSHSTHMKTQQHQEQE
ncbi:hypothetical protein MHYP_G00278610 [Metynnis hypsauchen]